jgi:cytoskeleton protein RodZ
MAMTEFKQSGFGAVLRQRREELGLSINDLAASTRIRKTYLQALEEENLQLLPGAAYEIGFLRIYARQLGLPVVPLLAALEGDGSQVEHAVFPSHGGDLPRGTGKAGRKSKRGWLLFSLLLLLLGAAGYFYLGKYSRMLPPRTAPVSVPKGPSSAPSVQKSAGEAPAVAQSAVSPVSSQGPSAVVPVELPVIPATGAVVRMIPLAAGTMKISLDSQEVREYQLQTDQSLNWKVSASLAVELSAPGLVRVWVDQQEIAVSEQTAFILKGVAKGEGRP